MDFNLSEDQLAFRDAARAFAEKSMAPHAAKWDDEHIFPVDMMKEAGEMGFMGMYTPEALGGMGLSRLDTSVIVEELAAACPSTAAFITIHNMATWMVASFASDDLKQEIVPKLASGEWLASYCLTEPGAGSDAASLRTRAERDGDSYVINGSKVFISGAGATDILVLMARTGAPDSGYKGISTFVIPADADGVSYGKNEEKLGWHSQPTRMISLENVRIPASNRVGEEGDGFAIAMKGLDGGRLNIATCSLGGAQAALLRARNYMHEREQFGWQLSRLCSSSWPIWPPTWSQRGRWFVWVPSSSTTPTRKRHCTAPWPSVSPPMPVSRWSTRHCSFTAVMATFANTRLSATCATCACTRFWKAPTKSCV